MGLFKAIKKATSRILKAPEKAARKTVIKVIKKPKIIIQAPEKITKELVIKPVVKITSEVTGARSRANNAIDRQIEDQMRAARNNIEQARLANEQNIAQQIETEVNQAIESMRKMIAEDSSGISASSSVDQEINKVIQIFAAFRACQTGQNLEALDAVLALQPGHETYDLFMNQNPMQDAYSFYLSSGNSAVIDRLLDSNPEYQRSESARLLELIQADLEPLNRERADDLEKINRLEWLKSSVDKIREEQNAIQAENQQQEAENQNAAPAQQAEQQNNNMIPGFQNHLNAQVQAQAPEEVNVEEANEAENPANLQHRPVLNS